MRRLLMLVPVSMVALAGCSTERATPPAPVVAPAETTNASAAPLPVVAPEQSPASTPAPAPLAMGRDPFEPSAVVLPPKTSGDDRPRKSKRFNIDQLKLVGIVSAADASRAMLVDPRGKGWVLTRGEIVGRPEVLHDAAGDHSVSWHVERIRESDVVLVREDATHSTLVPSSTRVLALRHDPILADDAEADD